MVRPKEGDGIKSNILIHEVQKRPCLYDSNHPHYGDRSKKARCWEEVCKCIVPGWPLLGLTDRLATGKDIQKRWRSIRDSYTKAFRQGKCVPLESCTPNTKRYNYHSQMSFLLKALQTKKPRYSLERNDSDVSNSSQPVEEMVLPKLADRGFSLFKPVQVKTEPETLPARNSSTETKDANTILPSDHFDDDKLFMDSLIPLFKKMNDDTRLMCRIEVLKIIRFALQGRKDIENIGNENAGNDNVNGGNTEGTASTLSMTTRSADGSRPAKKRRTHSPSPTQIGVQKKRGPGRPRKIRPPSSDDEEAKKINKTNKTKIFAKKIQFKKILKNNTIMNETASDIEGSTTPEQNSPISEPRMSELEEKMCAVASVAQLETPMFMKMYNLERAKVTSTSNQLLLPIKNEPYDSGTTPIIT